MGNFTDSPNILGSFNPFIQTLPVSEMVQVGTTKQGQYDQGVQRIQAAESSIDGLDIAKTETKNYISGRLGELNSQLQKVAGADFSNQQLVNQITGAASKIARDPIVQNGLISTANLRKGTAEMEDARKQGKSSPSNEYAFQKQAQQWLNDGKHDSSFSTKFSQFYDVDKDLREMVNAVGEDSYTAEQIFVTDKAGNILKNADGSPQLSPYATKQVVSGKGGQKLMDAISTVLNKPQVAQQVGIDGQYAFRNLDSKALSHLYYDTNVKTLEALKDKKDGISLQLSTASIQEQDALRQQLSLIDSRIEETQTSIQGGINDIMANPDPDNYRSSIYAQNLQNKYLSAFTTQKNATTYEENPGWNANMQMMNYKLSVAKENREAGQQTVDNYYKEKNYELDVNKQSMEMMKWAMDPKNPNRQMVPIPTQDPADYSQYSALNKFDDDNRQLGENLSNLKRQFVVRYNQEYAADQGQHFTEEDINKSIRNWSAKENKTPDQWINDYFEKTYPNASHANFRYFSAKELTPQLDQALQEVKVREAVSEAKRKDMEKAMGTQAYGDLQKIKESIKPLYVNPTTAEASATSNGGMKLTQEDMMQFSIAHSAGALDKMFLSSEKVKLIENATKYLQNKFGTNLPGVTKALQLYKGSNIFDQDGGMKKTVEAINNEQVSKRLSMENEWLKNKSIVLPDERYDLSGQFEKAEEKKGLNDRMIQLAASKYSKANASSSFSPDKVAAAVDKGTFSLVVNRSSLGGDQNKYQIQFTDEKGKPSDNMMEITPQDYKFLMQSNKLPFSTGISLQDQAIKWSPFQSTNMKINPSSKDAFNDAFYSDHTVPNVKKYVVKANAQQTTDGDYRVYLYIKDKNGDVRAVPVKDPSSPRESRLQNLDAVQQLLSTLNDTTVDNLLKNN